jgi:hypothetical protein
MVKANQHLAFSFRKKSFQGKRALNAQEKGRFQTWVAKKSAYQEKVRNRQAMRKSLDRMPPEEKSKILRQMKQAPACQRIQALKRAVNQKTKMEGKRSLGNSWKGKEKIQRRGGKNADHPSTQSKKHNPGKKGAQLKHPHPPPHPKPAKPGPHSKPNGVRHPQPPKKAKNHKNNRQNEDQ